MRNNKHYRYGADNRSITVNNITNITNITNVTVHGRDKRSHASRHHQERKPELTRFVHSCGLCDRDKVLRKSNSELFAGVSAVARNDVHNLMGDLGGFAHAVGDAGRCIGQMCGKLLSIL